MPQTNAQRSAAFRQRHPERAALKNREGQQRFRDAAKAKANIPPYHLTWPTPRRTQAAALSRSGRGLKLGCPAFGHPMRGLADSTLPLGKRRFFIVDASSGGCKDALF